MKIPERTSNIQHRTPNSQDWTERKALDVRCWMLGVGCFSSLIPTQLCAATNSPPDEETLVLHPPHAELPPLFWEQYGVWIVLGAVLLLAITALVIWLLLRPKTPVVVPVEVQARQELETLRHRTEDGRTVSEVSRVLRRFVAAAFDLPPDEFTTSEFCRLLADHEKIGPELSVAVGEFLRRCDEHKFAPLSSPAPTGAADRALELVELGEDRRARLRQMATATAATQTAQRA